MRWRDERGAGSTLLVLAWAAILLAVTFATDFARIFLVREQLRTAEDAAALAGALQIRYRVEMVFPREEAYRYSVCVPVASDSDECVWVQRTEWLPAAPLRVEGPEEEVWPQLPAIFSLNCDGHAYRCYPSQPSIYTCWLEPRESIAAVRARAREIFERNQAWGDQATLAALTIGVHGFDRARPREAWVTVDGELEMKTTFLAMIGMPSVSVKVLEDPPRPATAMPVRRGEKLKTVVVGRVGDQQASVELISPCDN